jgi:hypothetical protein
MSKIARIWRHVPKRQEPVIEDCEGSGKKFNSGRRLQSCFWVKKLREELREEGASL